MSDTPRADAGLWLYEDELGQGFDVVDIDIARQLERELAASEARVKELEGMLNEALAALGYEVPADTPDPPRYSCGICKANGLRGEER